MVVTGSSRQDDKKGAHGQGAHAKGKDQLSNETHDYPTVKSDESHERPSPPSPMSAFSSSPFAYTSFDIMLGGLPFNQPL